MIIYSGNELKGNNSLKENMNKYNIILFKNKNQKLKIWKRIFFIKNNYLYLQKYDF